MEPLHGAMLAGALIGEVEYPRQGHYCLREMFLKDLIFLYALILLFINLRV
jgi:hypothetical protein